MPFNVKSINIRSSVIEGSSSEKFIGITIDSVFAFEKQIATSVYRGLKSKFPLLRYFKFCLNGIILDTSHDNTCN